MTERNLIVAEKLSQEKRNLEYLSYILERGGESLDVQESFAIVNQSVKNIEKIIREIQ